MQETLIKESAEETTPTTEPSSSAITKGKTGNTIQKLMEQTQTEGSSELLETIAARRTRKVEQSRELFLRLKKWNRERMKRIPWKFLEGFKEAQARKIIGDAISNDLRGRKSKWKLKNSYQEIEEKLTANNASAMTFLKEDSLTHEKYLVRLKKEHINNKEQVVAEEVRLNAEGKIDAENPLISQAVISKDGLSALTLNFSGKRYEQLQANPNIHHAENLPSASAATAHWAIAHDTPQAIQPVQQVITA